MEIISREAARASGQVKFFTGRPCAFGHVSPCYVVSGRCYECQRIRARNDYTRYPDRVRASAYASWQRHKETAMASARRWQAANPEKILEIKRRNKIKHRERYRANEAARRRIKEKSDPVFKMGCRISKAVWWFLKGGKAGRKWSDLVGYKLENLKQRLESLFIDGMSWDNYGTVWEVDHIRPKSWFTDYPTPEDAVKAAWALTNLQPLPCSKNRSKGNRYEG